MSSSGLVGLSAGTIIEVQHELAQHNRCPISQEQLDSQSLVLATLDTQPENIPSDVGQYSTNPSKRTLGAWLLNHSDPESLVRLVDHSLTSKSHHIHTQGKAAKQAEISTVLSTYPDDCFIEALLYQRTRDDSSLRTPGNEGT